jgi:hypothetical protein
MRRLIIGLVTAVLCVGAVALVADAAPARLQPDKLPVPKARKSAHLKAAALSDTAQLQSMGIAMPETTETTALNAAGAIARARQIMAFGTAQDGVSATAREVRFTLDRFQGALPNGVVPKDLPAWVITIDGQKWHGHGGARTGTPPDFAEMNIVIDANTGAEVTEFAYK